MGREYSFDLSLDSLQADTVGRTLVYARIVATKSSNQSGPGRRAKTVDKPTSNVNGPTRTSRRNWAADPTVSSTWKGPPKQSVIDRTQTCRSVGLRAR